MAGITPEKITGEGGVGLKEGMGTLVLPLKAGFFVGLKRGVFFFYFFFRAFYRVFYFS